VHSPDQPLKMNELSIKVTIANRVYPLKIARAEEEKVRKAAKLLNDRIKEYENQYAVSDKIDLLVMCAMQFATEMVNLTENQPAEQEQMRLAVEDLDAMVTKVLKAESVH
jgi:cell division protein ZapA (FtsZ GTPase activity inhibitor)